ncbi:MAG: chemotaxis protein CheW [Desulfobacterales bacterium]|nr:chemotaxis protein CheW [Desulfobacterales bacterium]
MTRQIATFYIENTLFGLDILLIKEVYSNVPLTPIPRAVKHLKGLMNLRGKVVTVIDLNFCLNCLKEHQDDISRLIILKTDQEIHGFRKKGLLKNIRIGDDTVSFGINKMSDVLEVLPNQILPVPSNLDEIEEDMIEGVIKIEKRLIFLLNITAVLKRVLEAIQ